MLRRALPVALLVGMALGGATEAGATPAAAASVTIESSTILVGGKRGWSKGSWSSGSWSNSWSNSGWGKGSFHRKAMARHKGFHKGRRHAPAFVGKRFYKAPVVVVRRPPVVIVTPAHGRWAGYRYLPGRPLITNGRFTRQSFRW